MAPFVVLDPSRTGAVMAATSNPTWGYKPDGSAEIFNLASGEALPEGWEPSPACIVDPDLATADALSAAAEGRVYHPLLADPISGFRADVEPAPVDADALASALAEIERLNGIIEAGTTENKRLVEEIEGAEAGLEAAAAEIVGLKGHLEAAQQDGGFAVDELNAAKAQIEALSGELDKARADLDALTAPATETPAKGKAK